MLVKIVFGPGKKTMRSPENFVVPTCTNPVLLYVLNITSGKWKEAGKLQKAKDIETTKEACERVAWK